jgi:hypothetical protein
MVRIMLEDLWFPDLVFRDAVHVRVVLGEVVGVVLGSVLTRLAGWSLSKPDGAGDWKKRRRSSSRSMAWM